ncbi:MAG: hypothetical protein P4L03_10195 [Terracidiphilus sp.]|nr:hypothetical protein [Terracidiphilus sp.]
MYISEILSNRRLFHSVASYILFFIAGAAAFNGFYVKAGFADSAGYDYSTGNELDVKGPRTLEPMLDGTGGRPYVFRQLLPFIANTIDRAIPSRIVDRLYNLRNSGGILLREKWCRSAVERDRIYFLRYWLIYILEIISFFLATLLGYWLCLSIGISRPASALAAISWILLFPFFIENGGYIYDPPEMVFFFLAALLAIKKRWIWLIPVAALATANKESFLFFIPLLYPLLRQYSSKVASILHLGLAAIPCILINIYLHLAYRLNPGENMESHLGLQVSCLRDRIVMNHFHMTYSVPHPQSENILSILFLTWAFVLAWKHIPKAFRLHFEIACGINLPLYIFFGFPGEIRALSFLYISFLVLLATHLNCWVQDSRKVLAAEL